MTSPAVTGHSFGLCVCAMCGPPFRDPSKPWQPKGWWEAATWMALCPRCGSKRCPGAVDHEDACDD